MLDYPEINCYICIIETTTMGGVLKLLSFIFLGLLLILGIFLILPLLSLLIQLIALIFSSTFGEVVFILACVIFVIWCFSS